MYNVSGIKEQIFIFSQFCKVTFDMKCLLGKTFKILLLHPISSIATGLEYTYNLLHSTMKLSFTLTRNMGLQQVLQHDTCMIFSSCIALSSQRDSTSFFEYGGDRTGDSQDGAFIRFNQRTRLYVSVSRTKLTIYNDKGDDLSVDFRAPSVIKDVYMSTPDGDWTKVRFRLRRCTYHEFSLKILFFLY